MNGGRTKGARHGLWTLLSPRVWLGVLGLWLASPVAQAQAAGDAPAGLGDEAAAAIARGRQIYLGGRLADGTAVVAQRAGVGSLPPLAAACASCHRPSGRGGAEGGVLVPSIVGPVLYAPGRPPVAAPRLQRQWLRHQTRSAYDPATLARALGQGIDPDGQALAELMPRYSLPPQALADLAAYLGTLGPPQVPGHDGRTMHLASVITPDAPPRRQALLRRVMARWAASLRLGAVAVQWHDWTLSGPPAGWPAQLRALAQARPVYAVLAGAGGDDWSPVAGWCDAARLPCLFPLLDRVPEPGAGPDTAAAPADEAGWSVYLSAGIGGEARMLAQHWRDRPEGPPQRLVQVVDSHAAEAVASQLARAWRAARPQGEARLLRLPAAMPGAQASAPGSPRAGEAWVLWLSAERAAAWLAATAPAGELWLSGQLVPPLATPVPPAWRPGVAWVSMRADPAQQRAGAALSLVDWSQRLGLDLSPDDADAGDLHTALFFFADAVAQARGIVDRAYLIERLEVAVDRRPAGAGWFRLSLGPGQRIAAQGGRVIGFAPPAHTHWELRPGHLRALD